MTCATCQIVSRNLAISGKILHVLTIEVSDLFAHELINIPGSCTNKVLQQGNVKKKEDLSFLCPQMQNPENMGIMFQI